MANKYNAEGYFSPVEYEVFSHIEAEERCQKHALGYRPLVYICSPYASTPMVSVNENIAAARKYSRFAVERHCIPVTPHLLFPQFLDDCDKQEQQLAAFMGMVLLNHCQELWVFGDRISKGMKQEIQKARLKGKRIRWFTADLREKYFTGIKEAYI